MLATLQSFSLQERVDWIIKHERNPIRAQELLLSIVMSDPQMLMDLFGHSRDDVREKLVTYASERRTAIRSGATGPVVSKDHISSVTPERLACVPRRGTIAAMPKRRIRPLDMDAHHQLKNETARAAIMLIDGKDIRDWTIGQCLTASRHKRKELHVLSKLGNRLIQFLHTDTVSQHATDAEIRAVINEFIPL